ncbi:MAG: SLBB domain-containing protein [Chitinophagales bacterium]
MKRFSSLGLMLLILCSVFSGFAQTGGTQTGTTQTGTTQTGSTQTGSTQTGSTQTGSTQQTSGSQPSTFDVPGFGTVSESTLQSMGLSDEEIDAVLGELGLSETTTTTGNAIEQTSSTLEQSQQSAEQQSQQNTTTEQQTTETQEQDQQEQDQTQDQSSQNANQAAGQIFGQDFFRNGNITIYDKVPNAKASDSYIIGPGDQLGISVYGDIASYNQNFTVTEDGYIDVYGIGRIYLQGLTYSAAKKLLRQRFNTYISTSRGNFDVSLTYSKNIKVNIVGEVSSPGSYNIASVNTAFNALAAAGGPNDIGSVRSIQIKREGKVIKTLDVYQFLLNPGTTDDTYLENNDYIIVSPIGRVITIEGEVNRPHKYELVKGENLNELIYYAGGLKSTAYKRNVTIKRYEDNENVVMDINLDSMMKAQINFQLLDGDLVSFAKIPEVVENVVSIQGSVRFPGTYQLSEGLRISDVIDKAKGLSYEAYTERAYLIRKDDKLNDVYIPFNLGEVVADPTSPFNFQLTKFDVIDVFSKDKFRETFSVSIQGAIKAPGQLPYFVNMTLKDVLYYTGGLKIEAANNKIEISRIINLGEAIQDPQPTRVVIESIQIGKNLEIPDASEQFILQPYDIIYVRSTPEFEIQRNITIQGEVLYPGNYSILSKTETIADVVERAGGLTQYAYADGATITRNNVSNTLLFLGKALKNPGSKFNYVIREGDIIVVPKQGDLVSMSGAIKYPFVTGAGEGSAEVEGVATTVETGLVMVPFEKGRTARYYIKHYGKNFADDAKRSETYIIQPNGYLKRTHNILFIHFYPRVKVKGSEIVVPQKIDEKEEEEEATPSETPFDWNVFATTLSASILSFATIFVLVNNSKR